MEWDETKRQWTLQMRGLDFADAHDFEFDNSITALDARKDYGETRFVSTGYLHGRLCVLCWTVRRGELRIISLRKANDREKKVYFGTHG